MLLGAVDVPIAHRCIALALDGRGAGLVRCGGQRKELMNLAASFFPR
jgi:hypothetical protein